MPDAITPYEALLQAVETAGSQSALARACGVGQPAVWKWLQVKRLPAEYVLRIEAETGVSRHDLRPDIYPREVPHAPGAFTGVDRGTANVSFNGHAISQQARA
ncbi:helix-turn-helix domain-containing protein [Novosphingobium pentaromativorans]|uniref:HTH cro/C1-type domain-containing protein n=1 Tax=Novosphingobium pentaromativorans US6-1 TaxID=1088721 RepID=G6EFG7_9SPHN|nr:helix-turn-helix domain-containing protein [Novosphingobium pentaromativorans]EHJ60012.1 hypothetical protein NSU_3088 [Novosphingobium pentaromativorans US6-1]